MTVGVQSRSEPKTLAELRRDAHRLEYAAKALARNIGHVEQNLARMGIKLVYEDKSNDEGDGR